jgi:hypothetical protein
MFPPTDGPHPIISVLREQAGHLGKRTNNQVEGQVDVKGVGEEFLLTFRLVVPGLQFYTYDLFSVLHPIGQFPAKFSFEDEEMKVVDAQGFVMKLGEILGAKRTVEIINSLLGMVRDVGR